jgi:hypothetical protein
VRESGLKEPDLLEIVDYLRRGAAFPVLGRYGVCAPVFLIVIGRASTESVQGTDLADGRSRTHPLRPPSGKEPHRLVRRWPERGVGLNEKGKHRSDTSETR